MSQVFGLIKALGTNPGTAAGNRPLTPGQLNMSSESCCSYRSAEAGTKKVVKSRRRQDRNDQVVFHIGSCRSGVVAIEPCSRFHPSRRAAQNNTKAPDKVLKSMF